MKDWIIDIEQKGRGSKGLRDAYGYMLDGNRPSHYNTEITVLGNDRAFQNTVLEFDSLNQRGRTINNFATSAMLSMPDDLIHPTDEEWGLIADELLKNYVDEVNSLQDRKLKAVKPDSEVIQAWQDKQIKMELPEFTQEEIEKKLLRKRTDEAKYLNQRLDLDTVKETTGLIIHNESKGKKSSHLNVLISNIQDGEYKKVITQYGGVNALKKAYNKAVLDVMGLDNRYYTPKESRLENQPAYDPKAPFDRKKLVPEMVKDENGEDTKVRKKRRRKKPFSVARAEKLENERIKMESDKKRINDFKDQVLEKRDIVISAKNEVLEEKENIRDEKTNIAFEKKQIDFKNDELQKQNEILDKKTNIFEKVKDLFETTQEKFKEWALSLHSTQKKELEKLAVASADKILELEKKAPKQAKAMTVLAKNEEQKAEMLNDFIEDSSKVTHQVKTRRETNKRNRNSI